MTLALRPSALGFIALALLFSFPPLFAQRPSVTYALSLQHRVLEPRVRRVLSTCNPGILTQPPVQLFSQGGWFTTSDLALHVRQEGSNDDGTAMVWMIDGHPRALSVWVHDDEFDRSTLACLNEKGIVTRQINEYMPGDSEPDLHWIYIHKFQLAAGGHYQVTGSYTDWQRRAIHAPPLTSEDRDFIAGERRYTRWEDFDFAPTVDRTKQHSATAPSKSE